MKNNTSRKDRNIRFILGIIIAGAGVYFKIWWGLAAIYLWVTAYAGICPLYLLLGINTRLIKLRRVV